MSTETHIVIRGEKNSAIIEALSDLYGFELNKAIDLYYRSETASMIEDKISDLHCRSPKYLATLIMEEFREKGIS